MRSNGESRNTRKIDFNLIEKLFFAPQLADPAKQRVARIIHILSTVILLIGFSIVLISPFIFNNLILGNLITGAIICGMLAVQILNRIGKVRVAAQIFVYFIWVANSGIILISRGIHSGYLPSYIAVTIMSGLILGGISAFHFAGLSIISYLLLFYIDSLGYMLEPLIRFNHLALFIIFSVNILIAAIVAILVIRKYEDTFEELIFTEQYLIQANLKLKWEIESREQAEAYLTQSENRFKSAVMESPYPTMIHADDGEIISMNSAWLNKSGYALDDLQYLGDLNNQLFRDGSYQVSEILQKFTSKEETYHESYFPIYTKDGIRKRWYFRWTILPELPDGRSTILTIALDMTNLVDAESALRRSEENLSKLSLITNDGIWDWDLRTDKVDFDPRYYTMAGYEVDEFPHTLDEFRTRLHPDDIDYVFEQANGHLAGEIDRYAVEFRFQTKDGSWLWIYGRGKIIEQDENGNPLRFVGTHTDISGRKKVEEELNEYQQQLEALVEDRTQKLEKRVAEVEKLNTALSNILDDYQIANEKLSRVSSNLVSTNKDLEAFTFMVSNDLHEPINQILDLTENISKASPRSLTQKQTKDLSRIIENAEQIKNLISDLLKLSQINQQDIVFKTIDASQLVKKILVLFEEDIVQRKILVDVKDLPFCLGDPELVKTVFNILISNAFKFTASKKKPEITIGYQPDQTGKRVIYYIKDNGVGFSMQDHEQVFETFQVLSPDEIAKGTGIGLALAKKILNRHGGEIWAEAKKNHGATFYFDLELTD